MAPQDSDAHARLHVKAALISGGAKGVDTA